MRPYTLLAVFRTLTDARSYQSSITRIGYRPLVARSDFGESKGFPFYVITESTC